MTFFCIRAIIFLTIVPILLHAISIIIVYLITNLVRLTKIKLRSSFIKPDDGITFNLYECIIRYYNNCKASFLFTIHNFYRTY